MEWSKKLTSFMITKTSIQLMDSTKLVPPQWIQCDLGNFKFDVLGKFSELMADPPWDIHMELPYGMMSDDEMRRLPVPDLQDEGLIFLWVTGRAMELGRECLKFWGYERVDEIIWVKTNQLQCIIRTGRTDQWLNHGKEHCLVGGLDCNVIVAEVRATSHEPDEIYGIIERLSDEFDHGVVKEVGLLCDGVVYHHIGDQELGHPVQDEGVPLSKSRMRR